MNRNFHGPRAALSLALLGCTASCSFLFVTPQPPKNTSEPYTQSRAMPIVDGTVGGLGLGTAVAASIQDSDVYEAPGRDRNTELATGLAVGTVFLASLVYGSVNVRPCRAHNSRGYSNTGGDDREEQREPEGDDEYYDAYHWQLDDSTKADENEPTVGPERKSRPETKPDSDSNDTDSNDTDSNDTDSSVVNEVP